jgi:hypothetical protein
MQVTLDEEDGTACLAQRPARCAGARPLPFAHQQGKLHREVLGARWVLAGQT